MSTMQIHDVEDVAYRMRDSFLSVTTLEEPNTGVEQDMTLIVEMTPNNFITFGNVREFTRQMEEMKDRTVTNEEVADFYTQIAYDFNDTLEVEA